MMLESRYKLSTCWDSSAAVLQSLTPALPRPRQGLATIGYSRFKEATSTAALDEEASGQCPDFGHGELAGTAEPVVDVALVVV
jgi:hypothetical protein